MLKLLENKPEPVAIPLIFLEMAKHGYLYTEKTFILPQTQGKDATPLFLCVRTMTACRTNCSLHSSNKKKKLGAASWKREGNVISPPTDGLLMLRI